MSQIAIVGAGPVGLYAALKLIKSGVNPKEITIIDPRHGNYTRPGHLNTRIFNEAYQGLGMPQTRRTVGHICELEDILYQLLQKTSVNFVRQKFESIKVKTNEDKTKGIILDNDQVISANYVFDCSGALRVVVNDINKKMQQQSKPPHFSYSPITTNYRTKEHLVAYVQADPADVEAMHHVSSDEPLATDPKVWYEQLQSLRKFGWKQCAAPYTYAQKFAKDEICFYTEAPDDLAEEDTGKWMRTVVDRLARPKKLSYRNYQATELPGLKPKIQRFKLFPHKINTIGFSHPDFPNAIICGDATDQPDYRMAHGVSKAMAYLNEIFKDIEVLNGKIEYLDMDSLDLVIAKEKKEFLGEVIAQAEDIAQKERRFTEDSVELFEAHPESIDQKDNLIVEVKAHHYHLQADNSFKKSLHGKKLIDEMSDLNEINKAIEKYILAKSTYLQINDVNEIEKIDQKLDMYHEQLFALASKLFSKNAYERALLAYNAVFKIISSTSLLNSKRLEIELKTLQCLVNLKQWQVIINKVDETSDYLATLELDDDMRCTVAKIIVDFARAYYYQAIQLSQAEEVASLTDKIKELEQKWSKHLTEIELTELRHFSFERAMIEFALAQLSEINSSGNTSINLQNILEIFSNFKETLLAVDEFQSLFMKQIQQLRLKANQKFDSQKFAEAVDLNWLLFKNVYLLPISGSEFDELKIKLISNLILCITNEVKQNDATVDDRNYQILSKLAEQLKFNDKLVRHKVLFDKAIINFTKLACLIAKENSHKKAILELTHDLLNMPSAPQTEQLALLKEQVNKQLSNYKQQADRPCCAVC